eukprot:COSAG01_NODE_7348_length_3242_cov_1.709513_2_plen_105_part_00
MAGSAVAASRECQPFDVLHCGTRLIATYMCFLFRLLSAGFGPAVLLSCRTRTRTNLQLAYLLDQASCKGAIMQTYELFNVGTHRHRRGSPGGLRRFWPGPACHR